MTNYLLDIGIVVAKTVALLGLVLTTPIILVYLERRVQAFAQNRLGPNRVGPQGILQTTADMLKLLMKEDIWPVKADLILYILGPILAIVPLIMAAALIPIGEPIILFGQTIDLVVIPNNLGLLMLLAFFGFEIFAIMLAGWGSGSKYSTLGGLRGGAQMFSYELILGLAITGVIITSASMNLQEIVRAQSGMWNVLTQPLGFLLFFIASLAASNRIPFDLPEAESELTGGFHTEYSGLKWALFFLGEYVSVLVLNALAVTLFLGGWQPIPGLEFIPGFIWFFGKLGVLILTFMWIRASWPRLRYDQLMSFSWKVLIPFGLLNLVWTAGVVVFFTGN